MAKDVDTALREIAAEHGKDPDLYITELKNTQRYSRDVY
jgi:sulfite reductase alpha subunit-like flavoprotein